MAKHWTKTKAGKAKLAYWRMLKATFGKDWKAHKDDAAEATHDRYVAQPDTPPASEGPQPPKMLKLSIRFGNKGSGHHMTVIERIFDVSTMGHDVGLIHADENGMLHLAIERVTDDARL